MTSKAQYLKNSASECSLLYVQNASLKVLKPKTLVVYITSEPLKPFSPRSSSLKILKLVTAVPLNRKIPVKINRCLFEIKA